MNADIDITGIRLETVRLILRPWREEDLDDLYAYASQPGVGEMAGWAHHESRDVSKKILDLFIAQKKTYALELKETGRVIGSLGVEELAVEEFDLPDCKGRELGYVLGKPWWGKGLMPEAVKAVVDHCFSVLGCDFLTCCHFQYNDRSRRVIEKAGFRFEKEFVYQTQLGTTEPSRLYVLYHER